MEVKGINEKFDLQLLKKFCANHGYHLVDFNINFNKANHKPTGRGKIIIRNCKSKPDPIDCVTKFL